MKNFEQFGVQELNAVEMKETDGGILPLIVGVALVFLASGCAGSKTTITTTIKDGDREGTVKVEIDKRDQQ